jgi:hypothetical protein
MKVELINKLGGIGHSTNTSPKSKNKKRNWKQYRGQGK